MAESRLPPSEEARVRTAALVAAQRMNWDVPRQVLDYIVATSDPRQGPAALEMRAAGIVEYVKNHPSAPNLRDDREAQSFFRMIHGQVVSRFGGLPWALALAREEAETQGENSARFDGLPTSNWDSPAGQSRMRNYARECGVGWAGNHPELLRLGPGAIEALRDAHFRRESFQRLREAGFEGGDAARVAVGIARYSNRHGLDANRVAEDTARGVEVFGGNSPEGRAAWRDRYNRFFANPDEPGAREGFTGALRHMHEHGTPEQKEQARRTQELLNLDRQERVELEATQARVETQQHQITAQNQQIDESLAGLNGPPESRPTAPENTPATVQRAEAVTPNAPTKIATAQPANNTPRLS